MERRPQVFLNSIETQVPSTEVHERFLHLIPQLLRDERERRLFSRLASRCHIDHRYSVLTPISSDPTEGFFDREEVYARGQFSTTAKRMRVFQASALPLSIPPLQRLFSQVDPLDITHLIVTSCTGLYAPGLDIEIQRHFKMRPSLERTFIGFMGCFAAFNALKVAASTILARPSSKVLVVNLELCTLHLREGASLEEMLGFLQFGDGCAVSLLSADSLGLRIDGWNSHLLPDGQDQIQWQMGDSGFEMKLALGLPTTLGRHLPEVAKQLFEARRQDDIAHWAVHPGGRSILDVVEEKLSLSELQIKPSQEVLRRYGNMSSATIMFVLKEIISDQVRGGAGLALGFGPGLTVESLFFHKGPH